MLRFWLPPVIFTTAIFSAMIILFGRQSYHNPALEEFLAGQERCGSTCWAGIQPGVTSLENAIDLLQRHEGVTAVEFTATIAPDSGLLVWKWDKLPENAIDPTRPGAAGIERGTVTWLQIPTAFALGDLWLENGQPARAVTHISRIAQHSVRHFMIYGEQSVQWRSAIACPWQVQNYWLARVDLWLGRPSMVEMPSYNRPTRTACQRG